MAVFAEHIDATFRETLLTIIIMAHQKSIRFEPRYCGDQIRLRRLGVREQHDDRKHVVGDLELIFAEENVLSAPDGLDLDGIIALTATADHKINAPVVNFGRIDIKALQRKRHLGKVFRLGPQLQMVEITPQVFVHGRDPSFDKSRYQVDAVAIAQITGTPNRSAIAGITARDSCWTSCFFVGSWAFPFADDRSSVLLTVIVWIHRKSILFLGSPDNGPKGAAR